MGSSSQDLFGELQIIFAISISEATEKFENCSPLKGVSGTTLSVCWWDLFLAIPLRMPSTLSIKKSLKSCARFTRWQHNLCGFTHQMPGHFDKVFHVTTTWLYFLSAVFDFGHVQKLIGNSALVSVNRVINCQSSQPCLILVLYF